MSLPVPPPDIPSPPAEYDQHYMDSLLSELVAFIRLLNTPGELRGSVLNLSSVPSSPLGLEVGSIYEQEGTLKVLRKKDIFFHPVTAATGSIGVTAQSGKASTALTGIEATGQLGIVTTTP